MGLTPKQRDRFARFAEYLAEREPCLVLRRDSRAETAVVAGPLTVDVGAGVCRAYELEFEFPGADPFAMPDVWDCVGHFPADADRHIVEVVNRGRWWCLGLPEAPPVDFTAGEPLEPFLGEVRGFVVKQHLFDDRRRAGDPQPWPGSAWGHGIDGHIEWVAEQVGLADRSVRREFIPFLLGAPLAMKKKCPCGSGRKAGLCHRAGVLRVADAAKRNGSVRTAVMLYGAEERLR